MLSHADVVAASKAKEEHGQQPGWQVLQDSFTGLTGRNKMKDWDVNERGQEGEDALGAQVEAQSDSDAGDDEGW
ncbi:hypothetical protein DUNSADRAFT_15026 [Dunaliella salina]|uniref:Encoded protein n=1 Tax=Dunaliella salina TaxID=3046 RepID=A0ABQ7G699_DUNSA|nr:hypothetical protein DUNSADRAFT_15026 [Dunaliella salina]|eukprot:KAF5830109.1 hypothetical protein DUNSADRAFT_15026 [Dunaliella salina]